MRLLSITRCVALGILGGSLLAHALDAQDVPTVFQHGVLSDGSTWSTYMAPELRRMLKIAPVQPSLRWWRGYAEQANQLSGILNTDPVASTAATIPFVAHSGGGIVSRQYSRVAGNRINRLVTVASPHTGASLATNWLNGNILNYGRDAGATVADPIIFYDENDWQSLPYWIYRYGGQITDWLYNLAAWVCPAAGLCIETATGQVVPMARQVAPGSAYLQGLNSGDNLTREAGALQARWGLYTNFQPWNTMFYLMSQNPRNWIAAKEMLTILYQEGYEYYADHDDYWLAANAYRWLDGEVVLIDFDAVWQGFIGSLVSYDRYFDANTGFYAPEMVVYPNDGLIPNYAQTYPQGNNRMVAGNIAHVHQLRSVAVRDQLADILRYGFSIPDRPPGSTARVSVSPSTTTVVRGSTRQLTAYAYDIDNALLSGKAFSWSSSNTAVASVSSTGLVTGASVGTATISATSDGSAGSTAVTVSASAPSVSIGGPTSVRSSVQCYWYATPSGGTPPYTYTWKVGTNVQASTTAELYFRNTGSSFTITVDVRDAAGATGSRSLTVGVSSSAPICQL